MSVPVCHRTIAPAEWRPGSNDEWDYFQPLSQRCIGSRCALWVPEIGANGFGGPRVEGSAERRVRADADDAFTYGPPTGKGWCAENLRRAPWDDPALPTNLRRTPWDDPALPTKEGT